MPHNRMYRVRVECIHGIIRIWLCAQIVVRCPTTTLAWRAREYHIHRVHRRPPSMHRHSRHAAIEWLPRVRSSEHQSVSPRYRFRSGRLNVESIHERQLRCRVVVQHRVDANGVLAVEVVSIRHTRSACRLTTTRSPSCVTCARINRDLSKVVKHECIVMGTFLMPSTHTNPSHSLPRDS